MALLVMVSDLEGVPLSYGTVHMHDQKKEWVKEYFYHNQTCHPRDPFRGTKLTIFVKKGRFWKPYPTHLGLFLYSASLLFLMKLT